MIAFYISGHGFGHASRDIEVLNALGRLAPGLPVNVRTAAPRWFFDLTLTRAIEWTPHETDVGVVQIDGLRLDEAATVARARAFFASLEQEAARDAAWLQEIGATLVVGDIPPLAFAAAARAGLPSIALGNFTWDWIYEAYRPWMGDGATFIEQVRQAYAGADLALRLPMHGGFSMFRTVEDLPFIARRSMRAPAETRAALGLPSAEPLVLLSFGGYGLTRIDLPRVSDLDGYTIVVTSDVTANRRADSAPDAADAARLNLPANVRLIDEAGLYAAGLRYEDVVAAVDVVMTKPGYGIIAECAANDTAILYTSRGHFVEYDVLVREMPQWVRAGFISNEDLLAGRWQAALDGVMATPPAPERPSVDGADRAAKRILAAMSCRT